MKARKQGKKYAADMVLLQRIRSLPVGTKEKWMVVEGGKCIILNIEVSDVADLSYSGPDKDHTLIYDDPLYGERDPVIRSCQVCGCTEENACTAPGKENCHWIESDLCSYCEGKDLQTITGEKDAR